MERDGLDGLVLFRQDSMYYLTGYDTSGYSMFQGMYLGADGALALLTRSADRIQSRETSIVEDIRIWQDREDASPGDDLRDMLEDHGCRGRRLGVEYHAYGLTGQRAKMVDAVAPVALILPVMLMIAALTSQFSAAVADMGGGGGLLRENSHGHLSARVGYVSIAIAAVLLVWAVNLLEIVALASRAFAAYYLLQTLLALIYCCRDSSQRSRTRLVDTCLFITLALVLAYIIVFSIPAE